MDEPTVTVAILFVILAVHAVFAVYLYRSLTESAPDRPDEGHPHDFEPGSEASDPRPSGGDGVGSDPDTSAERTVRCPTCGIRNDPAFQFCRRCVSDLSEGGAQNASGGSTELGG